MSHPIEVAYKAVTPELDRLYQLSHALRIAGNLAIECRLMGMHDIIMTEKCHVDSEIALQRDLLTRTAPTPAPTAENAS